MWLTETGGIVKLGRAFPRNEARAARALGCMFDIARDNRRVKRLYVYQFNGDVPDGPVRRRPGERRRDAEAPRLLGGAAQARAQLLSAVRLAGSPASRIVGQGRPPGRPWSS